MLEIRISTGKYKNKKLKVPESANPLRERVKLAVFSIIGDKIENSKCLDLAAGSGNLGIEAISNNARECTFIDDNYEAIKFIKENLEKITGAEFDINKETIVDNTKIKIIKDDMTKFAYNDTEYYDIIFFDPPYTANTRHLIKYIHELINDDGLLIYFHHKKNKLDLSPNPELKIIDSRTYGITNVDFIGKI